MGCHSYFAFGLELFSDRSIPGLVAVDGRRSPDTRVWLDAPPPVFLLEAPQELWYRSADIEEGRPTLIAWKLASGAYFKLRYADGTEFVLDREGKNVWAAWEDSSSVEDTATYLLGPVIGLVLRLRGVTCLHASAIAFGDRAIAFMGPADAGKSTTAAAFSQLGYPVLSDDIVALAEHGNTPRVQPAYPQLRLWSESVSFLYGSGDALPLLTPTWDKRALDLTRDGCRFEERALPLAVIYVLDHRGPDPTPRFERLTGRENLLALLANTYMGYLQDAEMRRQEFESVGRLGSTVPVRRVRPPADPAHLPLLCARILEDCGAPDPSRL